MGPSLALGFLLVVISFTNNIVAGEGSVTGNVTRRKRTRTCFACRGGCYRSDNSATVRAAHTLSGGSQGRRGLTCGVFDSFERFLIGLQRNDNVANCLRWWKIAATALDLRCHGHT